VPGDVFWALSGPNFDGHDFIPAALEMAGVAVVGNTDCLRHLPPATLAGHWAFGVTDPLHALGALAGFVRDRLAGPVIGLTGSVGKTTTKDFLRSILEQTGPGVATEGNFNNLIGLPLTLFRLEAHHRWAVLEMGMNAFGEIARLAEIARPTIRLITNVGEAHTEGVGGLEGVVRAKGELFDGAGPGDVVLVNLDDPRARGIPSPAGVRRLGFGMGEEADVRLMTARQEALGMRLALSLEGVPLEAQIPIVGLHNARNALAAAAVAWVAGATPPQLQAGLAAATIAPMRMQLEPLPNGALALNDAYNANPVSMAAALQTLMALARSRPTGRAGAVLGDMLELGGLEQEAHRQLGAEVARQEIDRLFLWGSRAALAVEGAVGAGMVAGQVVHRQSHAALAEAVGRWIGPEDTVLFKGSRGAHMEKVLEALRQHLATG